MNNSLLYLVFSGFAALVSVAMWIDYFRRIDVFEKEEIAPLLLTLLIGGSTPFLSLQIYRMIAGLGFTENGHPVNDLLYAVFAIGLNEEVCKLIGVVTVFQIFKKKINEPIDYLIYAGVTALGFSLVENYNYFYNHGVRIITSRTFYSALEHIINTTIVIYGFYRYQLFKKGRPAINALVGFAIAVASHGLFDFFLVDTVSGYFTALLSMLIYLVGINFWIQMLNNANNYSSFFDYDKVPVSARLVYRLLAWYFLTLLVAFINNFFVVDLKFSIITLISGLVSDGFLFFIVILRISRFKILRDNYLKVRLEFPFYVTKNKDQDFTIPFLRLPIKIRGENYREHLPTRYLNRQVELYPVDEKNSFLKRPAQALISNKFLLFDDVVVYQVKFENPALEKGRIYLLKPKMGTMKEVHHRYPLQGLYYVDLPEKETELTHLYYKDLVFLEWVYLKTVN